MKDGKLDLNTIIGLLLIGGILFYFSYTSKPGEGEDVVNGTEQADSVQVESIASSPESSLTNIIDTLIEREDTLTQTASYGAFGEANNPNAEEELFKIENDVLEVVISSKGGQVVKARLKEYQTWDSLPLHLIDRNAAFGINLIDGDRRLNSNNLNFKGVKKGDNEIVMSLQGRNGQTFQYRYSIKPNDYLLDWEIVSKGFEEYFDAETSLNWEMRTFRHEKNVKNEKIATLLEYRLPDEEDVDDLSETSDDEEDQVNVGWVAYKQQFFSSILWNKNGKFEKAGLVSKITEDELTTKVFKSTLSLNRVGGELSLPLGLYLGPNKYDILKSYDQEFDKLIPLGWGILGWINRGIVINVFNWLEGYGLNYGIIILIIALLIKMILFPLTFTSYKSMAKMRVLKPEIDELNEKFKGKDQAKKSQATMQLYQKAGVNPLGGCIPVVLQFPILIALFRFFPSSIELRQQSFLWATDLSAYDSIYDLPWDIPFYGDHISLFTLLMTVSTLIYTYMNQQLTGQNQQFPQLKYMVYLMPVVFLGVFNNYAAGLSYYYFVANMITFGQQFAIRSYINDEKILQKIQEKKEKPKKENRIMRRMREIQEQQEEQQGSNRQNRRNK